MPFIAMARRGGVTANESWRLAAGHYISAKMAPQIVHPRPDAETNAYARCRRCPSAIEWRIPISMQGGAWPFYYEVTTGPAGLGFILQTLPGDWLTNGAQGYGVLRWSSPTVGSHTITVRVTDQQGTQTSRTWTLEVIDRENTTYFCFVDPTNGNPANSGAYSSPVQTFANGHTAANASKQIFYRSGTHSTATAYGGTGTVVAFGSGRAKVHVGFPGETAIIDHGNTAYWEVQSGSGDFCFSGLQFINGLVTENGSPRKQFVKGPSSSMARSIMFENHYIGGDADGGNDSNSSVWMLSGGSSGSYFVSSHSTFENCDYMDLLLLYHTNDGVFELNQITVGYTGETWGVFAKGNIIQRWSVRGNTGITSIDRPLFFVSEYVGGAGNDRSDIEVCWNNWESTQTTTAQEGAGCMAIGGSDVAQEGNMGPIWSYRNNWNHPFTAFWGVNAGGPYEFENDVIQHNGTYTDGFLFIGGSNSALLTKTNLAVGTSMVDATTNLLTGSARTSYLGTHGCEVN